MHNLDFIYTYINLFYQEGSMLIFGAVGFFLIGGIALNYWLQFKVAYNNENLDIRVVSRKDIFNEIVIPLIEVVD